MELTKFSTGGEILAHIKHDVRQIPEGKSYGNESVDSELSKTNYSLIDRGKTAAEINQYRKDFEKECFKYNRKNLVHSVELVIQCPSDCPQEQHEQFFQTAFDWYCNKYLPAGKDCVFVAEVHRDEHKYITAYENGKEVQKDISKEHLHIMYVPAVPAGEKHPDHEYRLNADQLTKRAVLRDMHPSLQKELEEKGIQGTVYRKKSSDGKTIGLSVKQLKEITDKYGITIEHSLTIDELAQIMEKNVELTEKVDVLSSAVTERNQDISDLTKTLSVKDNQIEYDEKEFEESYTYYIKILFEMYYNSNDANINKLLLEKIFTILLNINKESEKLFSIIIQELIDILKKINENFQKYFALFYKFFRCVFLFGTILKLILFHKLKLFLLLLLSLCIALHYLHFLWHFLPEVADLQG